MQAVKRLGGKPDSSIKTEGDVCFVQVIVNCLWHRDQAQSLFCQNTCDLQRTIAADRDERIHVMQAESPNDLVGAIHFFHGPIKMRDRIPHGVIAVACSQNGPAQMGYPAYPFARKRDKSPVWIFFR